ncbi:MAG: S41 family peptidase [Prolixibacteraceae bacterium]
MELLGKIWGFLKYHHPVIAKGNYNWDYELFRILPAYLANSGKAERDKILIKWIDKFGSIQICKDCKETASNAFLKPDHSWINNNLDDRLKQKLFYIYHNRIQGDQFYIRHFQGVGNPEFLGENSYLYMPYPDAGFRLLALYRYWNMIQYFFPYKHLTDKQWSGTLKEYIPLFITAKNELEYELAAVKIIGEIQDSHANLWGGSDKMNQWKGTFYPPVHVRFIEDKLVVDEYNNDELKKEAGLRIGDIITHINGKTIEELLKDLKSYYPASNEAARMRDISRDILRSNVNSIHIKYISEDKNIEKELKLYNVNLNSRYRNDIGKSFKLLDDNIGYITLKDIRKDDIEPIKATFKNTKGIIIDIRNYPKTFVPYLLGSYFVSSSSMPYFIPSSSTPFVKFTIGNTDNPGEFTFTETKTIPKAKDAYTGKLIVIVNELTQSQAEFTAMAFRAGANTTIIGSTTAGADGNFSTIILPGGLKTGISGIGVYYPNGKETQRVGIVPDIIVKPTIEGIKKGKDELIEKAIELIKG